MQMYHFTMMGHCLLFVYKVTWVAQQNESTACFGREAYAVAVHSQGRCGWACKVAWQHVGLGLYKSDSCEALARQAGVLIAQTDTTIGTWEQQCGVVCSALASRRSLLSVTGGLRAQDSLEKWKYKSYPDWPCFKPRYRWAFAFSYGNPQGTKRGLHLAILLTPCSLLSCNFPFLKCFPCKRAHAPHLKTDFAPEKLLFTFSDLLIKNFPSGNALLYGLRIEVAASRGKYVFHTKTRIGLLGVFPLP